MRKNPTYLTINRFGIYSFQVRLPVSITRYNPNLKHLIRFTLKTCDRAIAVRLARRKIAVLDAIKTHFNNDTKSAGRAIELWCEYENVIASGASWNDVDLFLANLDDGDQHLLNLVIDLNSSQLKQNKLIEENTRLKLALASAGTRQNSTVVYDDFEDDILFKDACLKFIEAKKANDSAKASIAAYDFAVKQFTSVIEAVANTTSLNVSGITKVHIRKYVEVMTAMPKNPKVNPITKLMSGSELVRFITSKKTDDIDVLAPKTVSGRFTIVRELMRFIEEQQYPIKPNMGSMIKYTGKGGEKALAKRRSFNDKELKLLFESEKYRLCKFKRPSDYWVPLLALFSGATQAELLQLYVADVNKQNGIWAIDINDKADKRLKTKHGRPRSFPIHTQLIKLGFDRYVQKCKENKQVRLFPDEARNDRDQFGPYSKRFNNYRKKVGVGLSIDDKVDFHSFRHLAAGILIGKGCDEGVVNDIIGHTSAMRSETRKTYAEGAFLQVKADALEKLTFDIDFNYVKLWR
jgi:integrase